METESRESTHRRAEVFATGKETEETGKALRSNIGTTDLARRELKNSARKDIQRGGITHACV
jgi:hypothetical protein